MELGKQTGSSDRTVIQHSLPWQEGRDALHELTPQAGRASPFPLLHKCEGGPFMFSECGFGFGDSK